MDKDELLNALSQFSGTEGYVRMRYPGVNLLLTDGVKFLTEAARCYWLMDVIASYQMYPKLKAEDFQVWRLTVNDGVGTVWSDDGNDNGLVTQTIPFTDFPLDEIKLYAIRQDDKNIVILLPSEN